MRVTRHATTAACTLAALSMLVTALPANAQPDEEDTGWSARIGALAMAVPRYEGADSHRLRVLPVLRVTYDDRYFFSHHGLGVNLLTDEGLDLAVAVGYDGGRGSGKDDALTGYRSVRDTAVGRLLLDYRFGAMKLHVDIATDLLDRGHGGTQATVGLSGLLDNGAGTTLMVGPSLTWGSGDLMHSYFSTTPDRLNRAALAGEVLPGSRPGYAAGAGVKNIALTGILIHSLNDEWSIIGHAAYARMMGDAADSPFVRDQGSRNQLSGGLGLSYSF